MASKLKPSRLWKGVRNSFRKSKSSSGSSSSSDSEAVPLNISFGIMESQCAKLRKKNPKASEAWIRNKAAKTLKNVYVKELTDQLVDNAIEAYDQTADPVSSEDTLLVKAPLSRYENDSYAKHKQILQCIDSPEKLSNLLLNPITKVDRLRLMVAFKKDCDRSNISARRLKGTVFQMYGIGFRNV